MLGWGGWWGCGAVGGFSLFFRFMIWGVGSCDGLVVLCLYCGDVGLGLRFQSLGFFPGMRGGNVGWVGKGGLCLFCLGWQ